VHRRVSSEPRALPHALRNVERALRAGRPHWLVGRVSRPSVRAGQAARRVSRAAKAAVGLGPVPISAWWLGNSKFLFYFSFGFKLNSNFKILYLNIQSSKNYEISSIGFIIFWAIQ
jgi:hypothetical protein